MLHMTETRQVPDGTFEWLCRCGRAGRGFTDRRFARNAGDVHLSSFSVSTARTASPHEPVTVQVDGRHHNPSSLGFYTACKEPGRGW